MSADDRRYRRRDDVAVAESPSRVVLLPLSDLDAASQPVALTDTAHLIWSAADGRTAEEAVAAVAEQVEADPAQIADDVKGFLDDLVRRRILTVGAEPSP